MVAGRWHLHPVIGALTLEGAFDATGERFMSVAAEVPSQCPGFDPSTEISKERLELFHISAFCADYALRHGTLPFTDLEVGANPPDFLGKVDGASLRLDCVAFADTHRRRSYSLMDSLREKAVSAAGDRDFSGVAGCVVSVWFGEQLGGLPPKQGDDRLVGPLLDEIEACKVDFEASAQLSAQIATEGFPQVMPPLLQTGKVEVEGESAGFVVNVVADQEAVFPTGLPFEMRLAKQADVTAASAVEHLQRLVSSHDKGEIDALVVTAGGPDRFGRVFPVEEASMAFLLGLEGVEVRATDIRSVYVHLWSGRDVAEVAVVPV